MTGALVGKVCAFPLCKILPKTSRGIYHPVTPLMQPYGVFVSNGSQGGGQVRCHAFNASLTHSRGLARTAPQEVAIFSALANFTHHGMIYVPIGYRCTLAPVMTSAAANAIRTHSSRVAASLFSPTWTRFTAAVLGALVHFPSPSSPSLHVAVFNHRP